MYVDVSGFISGDHTIEATFAVDEKLDAKFYSIFKKKTFVFMFHSLYDKINNKGVELSSVFGAKDDSMDIEEILSKDILTVLIFDFEEIAELVVLVQTYTKEPLHYLIVE